MKHRKIGLGILVTGVIVASFENVKDANDFMFDLICKGVSASYIYCELGEEK